MAAQQTGNPQTNAAGSSLQGSGSLLQPAGNRQVFGAFDAGNPVYQYDQQSGLSSGGLKLDQNTAPVATQAIDQKIVQPAKNIWQKPWVLGALSLAAFIIAITIISKLRRSNIFTS